MFIKNVIFTTIFLSFSFNVNARHFHAEIDSFMMTCKSWSAKKRPTNQSFIWDNNIKKMIVVGDAISEDEGRLIDNENTSYRRTINHQIQNWDGGKLFKMTFREDYLTRRDLNYHGGGSSEFRTLLFSIPNDSSKTSSVEAREFSYIEGILTLGHGGFLFDCQYSKE